MPSVFRMLCAVCIGLAFIAGAPALSAAAADPAAAQIERLDASLTNAMHGGAALGARGRVRVLTPAIQQAFDLPTMTRYAVGPAWTGMSEADHAALIEAFTRLTVASFAHNFAGDTGGRFVVNPNVQTRGPDKLVQTQIVQPQGAPVAIVYRMRDAGSGWKVIDVFFQGAISQLTIRRSDFAATLASGGAPALIAHLNTQIAKLME